MRFSMRGGGMMIQNNAKQLKDLLLQYDVAVIFLTHLDPDSVASAMLMEQILKNFQVEPLIFVSNEKTHGQCRNLIEKVNFRYQKVTNYCLNLSLILLDSCDPADSRLGNNIISPDIIIDHHKREKDYAASQKLIIIDEMAGATSILLYGISKWLHIEFSKVVATALAFGIYTDTMSLNNASHHDRLIFRELKKRFDDKMFNECCNFEYRSYEPEFEFFDTGEIKICSSDEVLAVNSLQHLINKANDLELQFPKDIIVVSSIVEEDFNLKTVVKVRSDTRVDLPSWIKQHLGKGGGAKCCQQRWYGGIELPGKQNVVKRLKAKSY